MSNPQNNNDLHRSETRGTRWSGIISSPFIWAPVITFLFYALIPCSPFERSLLVRYFCSHPLEYATAALFFLGMTILTQKLSNQFAERAAIRSGTELLMSPQVPINEGLESRAEHLQEITNRLSEKSPATQVVGRLRAAAKFIAQQKSSSGLQDHLRYLAEFQAELLHNSHSLVRTIVWAVPILGFLGTVMGITMAIANVTPEQLDSSMGAVTSGLAVAFDTTALALSLSLVLVFYSDYVRRQESSVLSRVEKMGIEYLGRLFPETEERPSTSLVDTEQRAAEKLMQQTEDLMQQHAQLWQQSTEDLRNRWTETLSDHQQQLTQSLAAGMMKSLEDHAGKLDASRTEFLQTLQDSASEFRSHLQEAANSVREQNREIQHQSELLSKLVDDSRLLAELQHSLDNNLQVIRATETFEQTMQTLNAAVHLLSARTSSGKAA